MIKKEEKEFWLVTIILGILVFFFAWIVKLQFIFSGKVAKGTLAKEYGVENKILMKWLKLFGSKEGIELYHGTQIRNVKRAYFTAFLGEPGSGPKHKDEPIVMKNDIWQFVDSNETTVREKITALEEPEKVIGMSYSTYKSLSYIPPAYMTKIIDYLENGVPPKVDSKYTAIKIDRSLPYSTF